MPFSYTKVSCPLLPHKNPSWGPFQLGTGRSYAPFQQFPGSLLLSTVSAELLPFGSAPQLPGPCEQRLTLPPSGWGSNVCRPNFMQPLKFIPILKCLMYTPSPPGILILGREAQAVAALGPRPLHYLGRWPSADCPVQTHV